MRKAKLTKSLNIPPAMASRTSCLPSSTCRERERRGGRRGKKRKEERERGRERKREGGEKGRERKREEEEGRERRGREGEEEKREENRTAKSHIHYIMYIPPYLECNDSQRRPWQPMNQTL